VLVSSSNEQHPKKLDSDKIASLAVTYTQEAFEDRNWIFRRQEGKNDFGIDAEIEIVEKNRVTGRIFKGQVKGQASINWNNGSTSISVSTTTYNLWKATPVPVVAFLCDVGLRQVYWNLPISQVPRPSAQYVSLRFSDEQSLEASFDVLEKLLQTWYTTISDNILREVPYFYTVFSWLREQAGGDAWCTVDLETDGKCRLCYHHLIELRLRMGLPCGHLPSIDEWYLRSAVTWGDDEALFHGTFEELIRYIEPDYDEAIRELRRRTRNVELCFENLEIINFFMSLDRKDDSVTRFGFEDRRMGDHNFARKFDEKLKKRNALRFSQQESVKARNAASRRPPKDAERP
jgi:Domain of unknown function (DUF4365)